MCSWFLKRPEAEAPNFFTMVFRRAKALRLILKAVTALRSILKEATERLVAAEGFGIGFGGFAGEPHDEG